MTNWVKSVIPTAIVALGAIFSAPPSYAGTLCEKGQIRAISSDYNRTQLTVSTGGTTETLSKQRILKLYGTVIWQATSSDRWLEKYTLLKLAYATGSYIYVWSNDDNCQGFQDEFRVIICQTKEDCTE
ncbi:hypothetical protein [Tahibacter soli]|uniref:Tissue inhibitor of metalloproteinase n=1 Tax=Tahibacter soli TaxID=2983605 RepID=A0A9X3YNB9_9GAMM|nr:hypothetical protein [Tahibacter soli]MDC8015472.1 hypothetical protein [Tahibacter soli]